MYSIGSVEDLINKCLYVGLYVIMYANFSVVRTYLRGIYTKHDFRVTPCCTTAPDQIRINPNCARHCCTHNVLRHKIMSFKACI
jgi:hypothetical protein